MRHFHWTNNKAIVSFTDRCAFLYKPNIILCVFRYDGRRHKINGTPQAGLDTHITDEGGNGTHASGERAVMVKNLVGAGRRGVEKRVQRRALFWHN